MNRLISIILLAVGIILIAYGINASNSIASSFSNLFSGSPTDKTIWLLISGVVLALVGAGGLFRGSRSL
jgi:amino acid permease